MSCLQNLKILLSKLLSLPPKLNTLFQSFAAASKDGIVTDPCTPKGYIYDNNSVQAAGNYSACRSATLAKLQDGKGKNIIYIATYCCSVSTVFFISYGFTFAVCVFFFLVVYRELCLCALFHWLNIHTWSPRKVFSYRKFLSHLQGNDIIP